MQLKQSLGVQTSAWYRWRHGTWRCNLLYLEYFACNNRGFRVFFTTWVLSSRNSGLLSLLSHCFQLVSFHLFHVLKFHNDSPSSESLSGGHQFQVLCSFFEEKSSMSSSFYTKHQPNLISGINIFCSRWYNLFPLSVTVTCNSYKFLIPKTPSHIFWPFVLHRFFSKEHLLRRVSSRLLHDRRPGLPKCWLWESKTERKHTNIQGFHVAGVQEWFHIQVCF